MHRRPPSSSGSSRPFTSDGGRPSTAARPGTSTGGPAGYYDSGAGSYPYSVYEEEEEEESEPEDVFAYLPPTTADSYPQPASEQNIFAHGVPPSPASHQPFAHHYPESTPPSVAHLPTVSYHPTPPESARPGTADAYAVRQEHPMPPPPTIPAESPPSTTSQRSPQGTGTEEGVRMRRIEPQAQGTPVSSVRPPSSREVHISLPPTASEKGVAHDPDTDVEKDSAKMKQHQPSSSIAGSGTSAMLAASMADGSDASIKMEFDFDAVEEEDSPFPEVRASVSNVDDPEMPVMTIRMWCIGLLLCMAAAAMNVFFNFRSPAPTVLPIVLLLVSYPLGKISAYTLPITTHRLPRWLPLIGAAEFSFNPGPWNIKEHVLVYIMSNVAVNTPYAINAVVAAEFYYDIEGSYWFNLVLVMATQLTGFGLAGVCRRFLVWPASMIWPQNLVACTLLNTLHAEEDESSGGITRYKFFMWSFIGSALWFFVPGYLFQALSSFSFICWIWPNNIPVNQLFGVSSGMGMSFLTFDWSQISWIGSPLMVPWWAELHIFVGFAIFYWVLVPILYYTNSWHLAHFPMIANQPYDKYGDVYNVTRVLTPQDTFNQTAYEEYSPLYMPATYAMTYLLAFTLSTCVIVHTILHHGRTLVNGVKRIRVEKDDIHAKLMRNYPEVPDWWYALSLVFFFALGIIAVEVWDTKVPVWALLLSLVLPMIYILPSGFIYAMTGQGIPLNLLAQIIPGSLLQGNPFANMIFKVFSVQTLSAATAFTQDLKLGHYIKVPPRATFLVQLVATVLAAWVQVGVKDWMFRNIHDICSPSQVSRLTCPHNQVFFTSSAIWGLIGPSRQFGKQSIYYPQLYALLIGAFLPVPFWLWVRYRPKSVIRYINTPVLLSGVMYIPPATGINYSAWFATGFVFQYLIRKRNFAWWSKFNYVTSAALDSGTAISLILIFFILQFPKNGKIAVNWWGNSVFKKTADWEARPWLDRPIDS